MKWIYSHHLSQGKFLQESGINGKGENVIYVRTKLSDKQLSNASFDNHELYYTEKITINRVK